MDTTKPPSFDPVRRDQYYWHTLAKMIEQRGYGVEDILRNWPAYTMRRDIARFISHYELFKRIIDLPGCVVELGVFKGASFFTWASLLETFVPADLSRKIYGFDSFEGLQHFTRADGENDPAFGKEIGGYRCTADEVRILTQIHNADSLIPGNERANLFVGDLQETIPQFLADNPGLKISLLHFDVDLYEPTKCGLELLYPLVQKDGIICFDEYGLLPWQGETRAVDEFFASIGETPIIRKHHFTQRPHGYIIK